jgi:uncharacterized membrane protein
MVDEKNVIVKNKIYLEFLNDKNRYRLVLRIFLALFYFVAGFFHLYATDGFVSIVPDWVPYPYIIVIITGYCELLGAAALMTSRLKKLAGIMLALYAFCVFPANIKHAIQNIPVDGVLLGWSYHAPRLALQPILIWLPLFCSELINWPINTKAQCKK